MRASVHQVTALFAVGAMAALASPAGAAECLPVATHAVFHHAGVRHTGLTHHHRAHGHGRPGSHRAHTVHAAAPAVQSGLIPVNTTYKGGACPVGHHSGNGEFSVLRPGAMGGIGRALQSAWLQRASATLGPDLPGDLFASHRSSPGEEAFTGSSESGDEPFSSGGFPPASPPPVGGSFTPFQATPPVSPPVTPPIAPPVTPPVFSAVPEPETWALMILGLAFVGAVARRRQPVGAAPAGLALAEARSPKVRRRS